MTDFTQAVERALKRAATVLDREQEWRFASWKPSARLLAKDVVALAALLADTERERDYLAGRQVDFAAVASADRLRAEAAEARVAELVQRVDSACEALSDEDAAFIRAALAATVPEGVELELKCSECGHGLYGYESWQRGRGLCRYCDGTAE